MQYGNVLGVHISAITMADALQAIESWIQSRQPHYICVTPAHSVVVITTWKGSYVKTDNIDGIKIIRIPPMNLYWVGEKDKQTSPNKIIWQLVDI